MSELPQVSVCFTVPLLTRLLFLLSVHHYACIDQTCAMKHCAYLKLLSCALLLLAFQGLEGLEESLLDGSKVSDAELDHAIAEHQSEEEDEDEFEAQLKTSIRAAQNIIAKLNDGRESTLSFYVTARVPLMLQRVCVSFS